MICQLPDHKPTIDPTTDHPGQNLCAWHTNNLRWQLNDILEWWALLPELLLPGSGDDTPNRRGKRIDPPAPIRLDIAAITDARTGIATQPGDITGAAGVIHRWACRVITLTDTADRTPTTQDIALLRCIHQWARAAIITKGTNLGQDIAILKLGASLLPDAALCARDITLAHRQMRDVVGAHDRPVTIAPCPVIDTTGQLCGAPLHQIPNTFAVSCPQCGAWWGEHELGLLGRVINQEAQP